MVTAEDLSSALKIYKKVATASFLEVTLRSAGVAEERASIFNAAIVVWLMIFQRLNPDHSLAAAIQYLKAVDVGEIVDVKRDSIRVRHGRISDNTGGYAQGRERVPVSVVEQVTDALNKELSKSEGRRRIYSVDGTTILVSCSEDNVGEYSQHRTRLGTSHYPLIRVELATDAITGVASKPFIGAHNGPEASSEITLVQEVLGELETGSVVLADKLYGVTQVIHRAEELGLKLIVRLRDSVAAKLIDKSKKESGAVKVTWCASDYEKKRYPHLAEVKITGRCVWKTIQRNGFKPLKLFLFTTCDDSAQEVVDLYGLRWNIEHDLRDLKSTLDMNFINAKSPAMIKKEILTGIAAYNLIRHFMKVVAGQLKTSVRNIGFKLSLRKFRALGDVFLSGAGDDQLNRSLFIVLRDFRNLKIPTRKTPRTSTPRQKWRKGVQRYRKSVPFTKMVN